MLASSSLLVSAAALLVSTASYSAAQSPTGLPDFSWNLLNVSDTQRTVLCGQQTKYCGQSGCQDSKANITINFCDSTTLASRCACGSGATVIGQDDWPIELADCQGRNSACKAVCFKPQYASSLQTCQEACDKAYGSTCGTSGQVAADYSVMKQGDKPSYAIITGGTAGTVPGAASLRLSMPSVSVSVSIAVGSVFAGFAAGLAVML
ncbi:hypothetical protein V8E36_009410 [Tilletia maclaganii]